MKKMLPIVLVVGALLGFASTASASYVTFPAGTNCTGWVYEPYYPVDNGGTYVRGHGGVSCANQNGTIVAQIETCLEVNNGGGWTGTFACATSGAFYPPATPVYGWDSAARGEIAACHDWYRSWVWVWTQSGAKSAVGYANYLC